jgi:hypothetical protein
MVAIQIGPQCFSSVYMIREGVCLIRGKLSRPGLTPNGIPVTSISDSHITMNRCFALAKPPSLN